MSNKNSSLPKSKAQLITTKNLIIMSLMVALNIILARFFSFMIGNSIRISLGYIPIIVAGILTGPLGGALTGIASDILGFIIRTQGAYFPGFTISYGLIGLIPGLIFYKSPSQNQIKKLLITIVIIELFISLILNTLWLKLLLGKAFFGLLPGRILTRSIIAPIEFFVLYSLFQYENFQQRI